MANLQRLDPSEVEHLNRHSLSEQEMAPLTEQQKALAKDWNIMNKKMDWLIRETILIHNVLADHDALLDTWRKFLWLFTLIIGSTGGIGGLGYIIIKISKVLAQ